MAIQYRIPGQYCVNSYPDSVLSGPPDTFDAEHVAAPENHCGENLEYDAAFIELERTVAGIGDQQYGETVIPAVTPDWHLVGQQASALLERSKDLRIVEWLTRAWTESAGLEGYAKGIALVAELLDTQWDGLHPGIEVDDDGQHSPLSRMNALQAFFSQQALGAHARSATLMRVNNTNLSLRRAASLLEHSGEHEENAERNALCAALGEKRASFTAPGILLADLERIRRTVSHRLGKTWAPDMTPVEKPLRLVLSALSDGMVPHSTPSAGRRTANTPPVASPIPSTPVTRISAEAAGRSDELRSRDEAILLLERVCSYLESREPAHPSSLLIRRAQRLLPMTFYEIIRDMTPEAIPRIDLLAGISGDS
jgi:type VI secretion system protein ImpA